MNKKYFNFTNLYNDLAELKEFDPKKLISEEKKQNEFYGFIIGLSLIYNDLTTLHIFHCFLNSEKPEIIQPNTKQSGADSGIRLFIVKQIISTTFEFLKYFKESKCLFSTTQFKNEIFDKLDALDKTIFNELLNLDNDKSKKSEFINNLRLIRHNISFHYSSKELHKGYVYFFNNMKKNMKPSYSLEPSDNFKTRYYFADASMQGYIEEKTGFTDNQKFYNTLSLEIKKIVFLIRHIIEIFIT